MVFKNILNEDDEVLDEFKKLASGTNQHCTVVSSICSTVAQSLDGVDVENLVVASRLHDIGKCVNPIYFMENQDGGVKNIHDELAPEISYQYLSRHVADGVMKLIQLGLSPDVIKIVSEHHGDSVIRSIYKKEQSKNKKAIKDNFRYASCKPTCIESCILMIVDVVESASRAKFNNGKLTDIPKFIDEMIDGLMKDEQLDILTIGCIRKIKKVLIREIESIYHKRIDYDVEDDE